MISKKKQRNNLIIKTKVDLPRALVADFDL